MCATETLDEALHFHAWCKTRGISLNESSIQYFEVTGRGVGAIEDIQKRDVIRSVPDDAVLMPHTCSLAKAGALTYRRSGTSP